MQAYRFPKQLHCKVQVQLAIVAGSTDNITVVIAQLRDVCKAHMSQDARPQRLRFYDPRRKELGFSTN
jgi:serine/threonine protein phosphatase PrpC